MPGRKVYIVYILSLLFLHPGINAQNTDEQLMNETMIALRASSDWYRMHKDQSVHRMESDGSLLQEYNAHKIQYYYPKYKAGEIDLAVHNNHLREFYFQQFNSREHRSPELMNEIHQGKFEVIRETHEKGDRYHLEMAGDITKYKEGLLTETYNAYCLYRDSVLQKIHILHKNNFDMEVREGHLKTHLENMQNGYYDRVFNKPELIIFYKKVEERMNDQQLIHQTPDKRFEAIEKSRELFGMHERGELNPLYKMVIENEIDRLFEISQKTKCIKLFDPLSPILIEPPGGGEVLKPLACVGDQFYNFQGSILYDENQQEVGKVKVYTNAFGQQTQTQAKNFVTDKVIAQENLMDAFGRTVLTTLPAPLSKSNFCYKTDFITNTANTPYFFRDFDLPNTNSHLVGETDNPKAVGDTENGSLGWYYSNNNMLEEYVPASPFPYSRIEYYPDPLGRTKRSSSAGTHQAMGSGHETRTFYLSSEGELAYVYGANRSYITDFSNAEDSLQTASRHENFKLKKTITVDSEGLTSIVYTNSSGQVVANCLSGFAGECIEQKMSSTIEYYKQRYVDIHLPASQKHTLKLPLVDGYYMQPHHVVYTILNLDTYQTLEQGVDYTIDNTTRDVTFYDEHVSKEGFYRISYEYTSDYISNFYRKYFLEGYRPSLKVLYQLDYSHWALNYYDKAGRLVKTVQPQGVDCSYDPTVQLTETQSSQTADIYNLTTGQYYIGTDLITESVVPPQEDFDGKISIDLSFRSKPFPSKTGYLVYGGDTIHLARVMAVTDTTCPYLLEHDEGTRILDSLNYYDLSEPVPVTPINTTITNPISYMGNGVPATNSIYTEDDIQLTNYQLDATFYESPSSTISAVAATFAGSSGGKFSHLSNQSNPIAPIPLPDHCKNGVKDGDEILIDCGGSCNDCHKDSIIKLRSKLVAVYRLGITFAADHLGGSEILLDSAMHFMDASLFVNKDCELFWLDFNTTNLVIHNDVIDSISNFKVRLDSVAVSTDGGFTFKPFNASERYHDHLRYLYLNYRSSLQTYMELPEDKHKMANTSFYNELGWLMAKSTPDEGISEYLYNQEGKLRCLQNAEQRNTGMFSYINYDRAGRVIETGEYNTGVTGAATLYYFPSMYYVTDPPAGAINVKTVADQFGPLSNTGTTNQTHIHYDLPDPAFPSSELSDYTQTYLLSKVSKTFNQHDTTWYSYDELGRLKWMVQKINDLPDTSTGTSYSLKTINYEYGLLGNVKLVAYQKEKLHESFYHHYQYDANLQLSKVLTSQNGVEANATLQAKFHYYQHGPLKRTELGENTQGLDYIYTINNWLKSINDPELNEHDPGKDGFSGIHNNFEKDAFGMTLDYHCEDYLRKGTWVQTYCQEQQNSCKPYEIMPGGSPVAVVPRDTSNSAVYTPKTGSRSSSPKTESVLASITDHFNGLIKSMRWNVLSTGSQTDMYGFGYDNMYRLQEAQFGQSGSGTLNNDDLDFNQQVSNVNSKILKLKNSGIIPAPVYYIDTCTTSPGFAPLPDYKVSGITYDKNGNLLSLKRNGYKTAGMDMDNFTYNYKPLTNQLTSVSDSVLSDAYSTDMGSQPANNYLYNEIGQLIYDVNEGNFLSYNVQGKVDTVWSNISKTILKVTFSYNNRGHRLKKTYYDAAGQAVHKTWYIRDIAGNILSIYEQDVARALEQTELPVYGLGRIGMYSKNANKFQYEIKDHLGNVRAIMQKAASKTVTTITFGSEDNEEFGYMFQTPQAGKDNTYARTGTYSAKLIQSATPAGPSIRFSIKPGQRIVATIHAYKDKKPDSYIAGLFLGLRRPNGSLSETEETFISTGRLNQWEEQKIDYTMPNVSGSAEGWTVEIYAYNTNGTPVWFDDLTIIIIPDAEGKGGILHTPKPQLTNVADYYPGGMLMPGRNFVSSDGYRFDYQGQEKDPETNWNAFDLRMYDGRINRWLGPDPLQQYFSPYLAMGNNPMQMIDITGGSSHDPNQENNDYWHAVWENEWNTGLSAEYENKQDYYDYINENRGELEAVIRQAKNKQFYIHSYQLDHGNKTNIDNYYSNRYPTPSNMEDGINIIAYRETFDLYALNSELEAAAAQSGGGLVNPSGGELRGTDTYGSGHYGASRGKRMHEGIDIITTIGQNLVSPVTGTATNFVGNTSGKPMIDITPSNPALGIDKIRILYVNQPAGVNEWQRYNVVAGQTSIGTAANLGNLGYPSGITPHVHVQVMVGGAWVDPTPYFFGR